MTDYSTIAIILVILIAFCIPFFYSYQKKKQEEKRIADKFISRARELGINISTQESWRRSYMIGLDKDSGKVLYRRFQPEVEESLIDLKEISRVAALKQYNDAAIETNKVVNRLWLSFIPIEKSRDILLEFYNAEINMGMMGETVLVEKWQKLIQERIDEEKKSQKNKKNSAKTSH